MLGKVLKTTDLEGFYLDAAGRTLSSDFVDSAPKIHDIMALNNQMPVLRVWQVEDRQEHYTWHAIYSIQHTYLLVWIGGSG
eukprot:882304-Pelagomonas_calceolata.AAC.2